MSSKPAERENFNPNKLTDAEIEELKEAFSAFDKDDSGSITAEELGAVLKSFYPAGMKNLSQNDLEKIVSRFDANNDGTIDFNEFVTMMGKAEKKSEDELQAAFNVFDKDGDGTISAKEIMTVMKMLGEDVDEETCALMIKSVDLDGNNSIDVHEFQKMMRDGFNIADEGKTNK